MQMIDVMKRLAALDEKNPNVLKENVDPDAIEILLQKFKQGEIDYEEFKSQLDDLEYTDSSMRQGEMGTHMGSGGIDTPAGHRAWDRERSDWDDMDRGRDRHDDWDDHNLGHLEEGLAECGDMMSSPGSSSPASIHITAGSGDEVADMLATIMHLAGSPKEVDSDDLGHEREPAVLTTEPVASVGPVASDQEFIRGVMDKLNPDFDSDDDYSSDLHGDIARETYDNTPDETVHDYDPTMANRDQSGSPGAARGRNLTNHPIAMAESLMAEYQAFLKSR